MSNFIGDLIGRHKDQGTSPSAKAIVEPRPKARYEADSDFTNAPTLDHAPLISENATADIAIPHKSTPTFNQINRNATLSTPSLVLDTIFDKGSSRQDRVNEGEHSEQEETTAALLPNRVLPKKMSIPSPNNKDKQKHGLPSQEHKVDNDGHHDDRQVANNLDVQIQSILQRLKTSEGNHSNENVASLIDKESRLSSSHDHANTTQINHVDNFLKDKTEGASLSSPVDKGKPYPPVLTTPLKTNQEGQLTIPNWLASMQSDINQRWQHLNEKIESAQPVVNVTIGRVEVRAVQGAATIASNSQKQAQKKPSGVMSLSDYLKSRDKEGRA